MNAKEDLFSFVKSSVRGIVDDSEKSHVECIESGSRTFTFVISCGANDLKFVYSRLKAIKFIAIAIAQRHKCIVNILVND